MSNTIVSWNNTALDVLKAARTRPPEASRAMAMVHVAMHEAVIAATHATAIRSNQKAAACSVAAHAVLRHLFPGQSEMLDARLDSMVPKLLTCSFEDLGLTLGEQAGKTVLQWRERDHSEESVPYVPEDRPGAWRPTPPGYENAHAPHWPMVTPFSMSSGSQFRSAGYPALASRDYALALNKTKRLGAKNSEFRTDDQTEIAQFWSDGAGTVILWNLVAQQAASSEEISLPDTARVFALLNTAIADAVIAAWDDKYHFNLWRPVTAIREADTDGNPLTEAEPGWEPLCPTTPEAEHTSAHCTVSGAASRLLELFFERDDVPFVLTSVESPQITRLFRSFSEAASEAVDSRVYAGLHFEFSTTTGLDKGRRIAEHVWQHGWRIPPEVLAC